MSTSFHNMVIEESLSVAGFYWAGPVVAGSPVVVFTPVGRPVSVRVVPASGQTILVEDSISSRSAIVAGAGNWMTTSAGGLTNGVASVSAHYAYVCPMKAIRFTGTGNIEVLA